MDRDDAEGQVLPGDAIPARLLHLRCKIALVRPGLDRLSQVDIGIWVGGGPAGDLWEGAHEVFHVNRAENGVCGVAELADYEAAARFGDPEGLFHGEDWVLGISKAEGDGRDVELLLPKGQGHGIALDKGEVGVALPAGLDHAVREVEGYDLSPGCGERGAGGAGSGRLIENLHARLRTDDAGDDLAPRLSPIET